MSYLSYMLYQILPYTIIQNLYMYVYATGGPSRTHSAKWRICILQTVSCFGLWPFRQGATGYLPRRLNLLLRDQLRRDQFHFEASRFVACLPVIKPIEADSALISFVNVLNWGWRQDPKSHRITKMSVEEKTRPQDSLPNRLTSWWSLRIENLTWAHVSSMPFLLLG